MISLGCVCLLLPAALIQPAGIGGFGHLKTKKHEVKTWAVKVELLITYISKIKQKKKKFLHEVELSPFDVKKM